ncbi:unnamed protein product, partial [Polarella glacialis]
MAGTKLNEWELLKPLARTWLSMQLGYLEVRFTADDFLEVCSLDQDGAVDQVIGCVEIMWAIGRDRARVILSLNSGEDLSLMTKVSSSRRVAWAVPADDGAGPPQGTDIRDRWDCELLG